jgi:hypothetical protein
VIGTERTAIVIESGKGIAIKSAIINIAAKTTTASERRREIRRRRGRDIGIVHCREIDDVDAFFGTDFGCEFETKHKTSIHDDDDDDDDDNDDVLSSP